MEYHHAAYPVPDGYQFLRPDGIAVLYRLGCSSADDRLLLRRPDLPFRSVLSVGTDALVLETVALSHPGGPGNLGVCEAEFDGRFDGRDSYGIYYAMDTMCRLFPVGLPGIPV